MTRDKIKVAQLYKMLYNVLNVAVYGALPTIYVWSSVGGCIIGGFV